MLRAILQSRTAARKELLDQHKTPDECEKLYEESLWCLYALQDDLLQKDNPFMDEDRETISTCASALAFFSPVVCVGARRADAARTQGSSGRSSASCGVACG